MSNKLLKTFVFTFGILFVCFNSSAKAAENLSSDTSKKILASVSPRMVTEVYDINVEYPEIFDGNQEQTLAYVEKFSTEKRTFLINIFKKSDKYFSKITEVFERYAIPEEFKILMALESQFNGKAVSRAGAVGYWQFMDEVAKDYGLRIPTSKGKQGKKGVDERMNFSKSTNAAARYLRDRAQELNNDWLLIAASYNWGIGNVKRAMKKTGLANPGFWDIKKYLPKETKNYVMNFIAVSVIFNNYEKFIQKDLRFEPVIITRPVRPLILAGEDA